MTSYDAPQESRSTPVSIATTNMSASASTVDWKSEQAAACKTAACMPQRSLVCRSPRCLAIDTLMSFSMWVSPTRIRIPDTVVLKDKLRGSIRIPPPFLRVEILAPEDTPARFLRRLEDILNIGCEHLSLLDRADRAALTYTRNGLRLAVGPSLTVPGSPIQIDLSKLLSALD